MARRKRTAFDIGKVLTKFSLEERKLANGGYVHTDPDEGAIETVQRFAEQEGPENLFVISRVRTDEEVAVNHGLLKSWNFEARTGILEKNILVYVGKREQKAEFVSRRGIKRMVDDRIGVLAAIAEADPDPDFEFVAFKPRSMELNDLPPSLSGRKLIVIQRGWDEIHERFFSPLQQALRVR